MYIASQCNEDQGGRSCATARLPVAASAGAQISGNERFMKNTRFYHFFVTAPKKFSSGRQSDNFEDWRLAHSSYRSWCSKFSETLVDLSDTSKIVGPSPLRSQVIRNHDRQKECFLTNFWEKMVCFTKLTPRTPPSVIHGWKATDLLSQMVKRKNYLLNPVSRQNFANALAENHNLKLEVCPI